MNGTDMKIPEGAWAIHVPLTPLAPDRRMFVAEFHGGPHDGHTQDMLGLPKRTIMAGDVDGVTGWLPVYKLIDFERKTPRGRSSITNSPYRETLVAIYEFQPGYFMDPDPVN